MRDETRTRMVALAAVLAAVAIDGDAAGRQAVVTGTVVDIVNLRAVPRATVTVVGAGGPIVTGTDGRFEFRDLAPGEYLMRFAGPGYAEREDTLRVFRPGSIDLRVALTPTPYELDPIGVDARSASPFLDRVGFYRRRAAGIGGVFLDRAAIARRHAAQFTDLFREIPGAIVRSQGMGAYLIRFNRMMGAGKSEDGCIPDLYVDGLITGGRPGRPRPSTHDVVDPDHIEAIEVYTGATTPIEYQASCGVILVWTRHR